MDQAVLVDFHLQSSRFVLSGGARVLRERITVAASRVWKGFQKPNAGTPRRVCPPNTKNKLFGADEQVNIITISV
jgi:hypothetical protein